MIIKDENLPWASLKSGRIETIVKTKDGTVPGAPLVRTPSRISKFIFANKSTKEIYEKTKVKNKIRFWLKNTTLVYNYCQCWKIFKSLIIKSKS